MLKLIICLLVLRCWDYNPHSNPTIQQYDGHLVVQQEMVQIIAAEVPDPTTRQCRVQGVEKQVIFTAPKMNARHDQFDYG